MSKLNELSVIEAREGLKSKRFTSVELTTACLAEIDRLDSDVKAFITVLPDHALGLAAEADKLIAAQGAKIFETYPLLGIPYACKDNYSTLGIETTAASAVLKGYIPPYESTVTKKVAAAGAVLLGKTNLDAFAHGASTDASDFFVTRNPWDLTRVPGGSSGGSAAAVAAHLCIFALGSDTGGSIRCPASWCGVTGLKPSYGRVSRYGLIAMASSTDSPGPLTKTAADASLILQVIAGQDSLDATSLPDPVADYLNSATDFSVKGLKIGVPQSYFELDFESAEIKRRVTEALEYFKSAGAQLVTVDLLPPKYAVAAYTVIQRSEVSSNLARFDGIRFGHQRAAFGFEARRRMMLGAYALSSGYYDEYYSKAQKVRTLIINGFAEAFKQVDVIIGPTLPNHPAFIGQLNSSPVYGELIDMLQQPGSLAGLPVISIPCGLADGFPVGMQLIGPGLAEKQILGLAQWFQQTTKFHAAYPTALKEINHV